MKKPGNKVIAIYLIWVLIHFLLFLFRTSYAISYGPPRFYPFTKIYHWDTFFDYNFYDYTEFMVYSIAPILIYYAITFWNKKPNE